MQAHSYLFFVSTLPSQLDNNLVYDDELCFPDGSILVVAQARAFRVYHGILMKESPIFQDLLSLPQPADVETIEGCPVIHLADTAADVQALLRFLFSRR